ncbi:tetratricopeptide repeat protein [Rubrivivax gelatinosus]|uniref:Tetratricopeptide repeat protein 38 n=1 Tax=Rubrivivax gelatinosus (strain NBRC 100245 / IL144) TaxID=983917 RepID=I0HKJ3_RUBGI|nr:tetratricopeptide repeat protein [Rubrivivax gelatinosus]BAL93530.1 hypothetical protein RGE_01850 [Rubrivivax gelatinosus IL144]
MAFFDLRGNPVGCGVAAARDAAESALWRLMSYYDSPLADLDAAIAADPGWAMPYLMKAGWLLAATDPGELGAVAQHLDAARERLGGAGVRERAHLEALQLVLEGRWHNACRRWDDLLLEYPRDALALQWSHQWDLHRGDAAGMRMRPARSLPDWDGDDPLYPFVLGLYAFGLEECNLYPQAEEAARQALQADRRVTWAVHAVAHVLEMQGRHDEGSAWLRLHQHDWAEGNEFASHLWWHKALFRVEAMDCAGVLRLIDGHLTAETLTTTTQRVDAAAMLWRLHLVGEDVSARALALVDAWADADDEPGYYAFNDLHRVTALIAAGQLPRAERWVARCAERALAIDDARRVNHTMAREVGLPLMRAFLAFARGDVDTAADILYPARMSARALGGSHAQRDLIDQTLLAAAVQGRRRNLGRALLNERLMAKPATALTRHWASRLGLPREARA